MRRWETPQEARRVGFIDGFTAGLGVIGAIAIGCLWLAGLL